jgi:hypothetical protein
MSDLHPSHLPLESVMYTVSMTRLFLPVLSWFGAFFRSRYELGLRLAALRQQMTVFKRQNPRPRLNWWDRLFWLALRRLWPRWASVLLIVKPESVVRWHRTGFRWYWRLLSRHRPCLWRIDIFIDPTGDRTAQVRRITLAKQQQVAVKRSDQPTAPRLQAQTATGFIESAACRCPPGGVSSLRRFGEAVARVGLGPLEIERARPRRVVNAYEADVA